MIAPTTVKLNQIKGSQSGLNRRRNIITLQVSNGLWFRTIIRQTIPGRRKYCGQEVRRGAEKVGLFEMFNQLLSTLKILSIYINSESAEYILHHILRWFVYLEEVEKRCLLYTWILAQATTQIFLEVK